MLSRKSKDIKIKREILRHSLLSFLQNDKEKSEMIKRDKRRDSSVANAPSRMTKKRGFLQRDPQVY